MRLNLKPIMNKYENECEEKCLSKARSELEDAIVEITKIKKEIRELTQAKD